MKAEATVVASDADKGTAMLTKAFDEFYGNENWTFTSEPTAEADSVLITGEVLSWRVYGIAEG